MARRKKLYGRHRSARIVRGLVAVTGCGSHVFNDAIVGGRSIKVWGWTRDIYLVAIEAMQRQGIAARLVNTTESCPGTSWRHGRELRIHTQEA